MAKANRKSKTVVDDVLSEDEIAAAVAAAEAGDEANEADVESAAAEVEKIESVAKARSAKATTEEDATGAAVPKAPAVPRMSLDTHKASEIIVARLGGTDHHGIFDLDGSKKVTAANLRKTQEVTMVAIDALDKKAREKAINLFVSVNAERAPSVYTRMACTLLASKGQFTQKDLTDYYLVAGYKIGTARRQAGEMVALFPVVGICTKEAERGSPCVLNKASKLFAAIEATPVALKS